MAKRSSGRSRGDEGGGGGEVALGLFALGSSVYNIYQAAQRQSIEAENAQWRRYATDLKDRYDYVCRRHRFVAEQYQILKSANEQLRRQSQDLSRLNERFSRENAQLVEERGKDRSRIADLEAKLRAAESKKPKDDNDPASEKEKV